MKRGPLLSPELKAYVAQLYLGGTPPRELAVELKQKFGVSLPSPVLRQWCTRNGLGKRKKELDARTCALVSSATVSKLATAKASDPRKHLERWATRTVGITDKAFDLAESSGKPRDFSSAVGSLANAIKTYRICAGIDTGPSTNAVKFNFHFASEQPRKVGDSVQVAVDLPAGSPASASPDDESDGAN